MADSHVNIHDLAPGQKQGDPHPENPFSEHKYPTFFRLYKRGDKEFKAPLDLDDDEYLPKNWKLFEDKMKQEALQLRGTETNQTQLTQATDSIDFEKYHDLPATTYSVLSEARVDNAAVGFMTRVIQESKKIAANLGIRQFTADDASKLQDIEEQITKAQTENNHDLLQKLQSDYETVQRRGASEEVFGNYQRQVAAYASSLEPSFARKVELSISPSVFETISGSLDGSLREGGWYDADYYPEALRRQWIQQGLVVQVPKSRLHNMTTPDVFGKELGTKLDTKYWNWTQYALKLKQQKFGAKAFLGIYGGVILYGLYFKWIQINEKEYFRQKSKYALRLMHDDNPLTPAQLAVFNKHSQWASKYYEEEEEEAEEEAAEEGAEENAEEDE